VETNVATNTMTNEMTVQEEPSLYDRLGGVYNIATVIDDLIDRVMGTTGSMPIHGWTRPTTECRLPGSSTT